MRILLTAFEPFEGATTNATELLIKHIRHLAASRFPHPALAYPLATAILPVADRTAAPALHHAIDQHTPDLIISLGEAAARTGVGIERLAINLRDYRIPDNEGAIITEQPVIPDAPAAYFATLPLQSIREAFERRAIPARISRDAGTFLCNQIAYELFHRNATSATLAGFIHIPLLAEQLPEITAGKRSMPRPGPGVFDTTASDGSHAEASTNHWHRTLTTTAVPLETMALALLDAIMASITDRAP